MRFSRVRLGLCLLVANLSLMPAQAQKLAPLPCSGPAQEGQTDEMLVYGDGFAFAVKEPPGWKGDCEIARKYGVNIVFLPEAAESKSADVTIRVRVNDKTDEDTAADLQADRDTYKREYPQVQFDELAVSHPQYATFSEVFFLPGSFYEYVAYVNPGPKHHLLLSVAMSKARSAATPAELEAFRKVLGSLQVLSDSLKVVKPGVK